MNQLKITVPGPLRPKSVRIGANRRMYNSKPVRDYMTTVRMHTNQAILRQLGLSFDTIPAGVPVECHIVAYIPWPSGTKKALRDTVAPHTSKPDADNIEKPIWDGITEAQLWTDDNQVYYHSTRKMRCKRGEESVEILVSWEEPSDA